jgi:hypothetical protein
MTLVSGHYYSSTCFLSLSFIDLLSQRKRSSRFSGILVIDLREK